MSTVFARDLIPHPQNLEIYGDQPDVELIESIRDKGVLNPVLITNDFRIISGHRRWEAAKAALGTDCEIPVVYFASNDELDVVEALIHSNLQRAKTNEQIGREYRVLQRVIAERNRRVTQTLQKTIPGEYSPADDVPNAVSRPMPPSEAAAEMVGVARKTASRATAVVAVIDDLEDQGRRREASQLRNTLNGKGGITKSYNQARQNGLIATTPRESPITPTTNVLTLEGWAALTPEQQEWSMSQRSKTVQFNSQTDNNIEWALWSWNPVTGCLHNCSYCYARDIAERFYEHKFAPALIPERLAAPSNTAVPKEAANDLGYKNVFTCSMADLFGRWVPTEWIQAVLDEVASSPQWNFLFLTKFPIRLQEFTFPSNAWVGSTVDAQARVASVEAAFERVDATVKWLSCEPMLEKLTFTKLDLFDWVVIGGASSSTATPEFRPPRQWTEHLEAQARAAGCHVYEKTNLLDRIKEYPGQTLTLPVDVPTEFGMGYLQRDVLDPGQYSKEFSSTS